MQFAQSSPQPLHSFEVMMSSMRVALEEIGLPRGLVRDRHRWAWFVATGVDAEDGWSLDDLYPLEVHALRQCLHMHCADRNWPVVELLKERLRAVR
ncbi:MAG: hypothetical protein ACE366_28450 [Bradymonadia bacterium]